VISIADFPSVFFLPVEAPRSRSSLMTCGLGFGWATAAIRGVWSVQDPMTGSSNVWAVLSTISCTRLASFLWAVTAMYKGILRSPFFSSTLAPFFRRSSTIFVCPAQRAYASGVNPEPSLESTVRLKSF
jgi:hypothetical protein